MKLISLHIENFGVLSSFDYTFSSDINKILQDNGTGKTTLAAFISAMFYGMEGVRSNSKDLKQRSKYAPWNGGIYGGNLTFEAHSEKYRIERTFDDTSAVHDICKVYNLQTNELLKTKEPGETFLSMSRDAFLRLNFLSGNETGDVSSVLDKLRSSIEGTNSTVDFDNAIKKLLNARKKYQPDRGTKGVIYESGATIRDLEKKEAEAKDALELSASLHKDIEEKTEKIGQLERMIDKSQQYQTILSDYEKYKNYLQNEEEALSDLNVFQNKYGKEPVSETKLKTLEEKAEKIRQLEHLIEQKDLSEGETAEYRRISEEFGSYEPDEKEFDEILKEAKIYKTEKEKAENLEDLKNGEEYHVFNEHFKSGCPTSEELMDLHEKIINYSKETEKPKEQPKPKKSVPVASYLLASAGGITAIAGVILMILKIHLSVLVTMVGILILLSSLFLFILKGKTQPSGSVETQNEELIFALKKEISTAFEKYYTFGNDFNEQYKVLTNDVKEYERFLSEIESEETSVRNAIPSLKNAEEKLITFFKKLDMEFSEESISNLSFLKEDGIRYLQYKNHIAESKKQRDNQTDERNKLTKELQKELENFPKEKEGDSFTERISYRRTLNYKLENLVNTYNKAKKDAENFASSYNVSNELPKDVPSTEDILNYKNELQKRREEKESLISEYRKQNTVAEKLTEYQEALSSEKETLEEATKKANLLEKTRTLLEEAQKDLTARYTRPILEKYTEIANEINPFLAKGLFISSDLTLSFERNGIQRKSENFSSGFCALSDICLRVALLRVLYPQEQPFLILDDPFVYLDNTNMENALESLEKLSEKMQILYFTCNNSRI